MLLVTRPPRLQVTEQAASFFLLAAAVSAPRCRGDSRIRFFLLRRPPEQYAVTSTNHARPLELVPATELASAAALAPTVALVPASPAGEEAAHLHCTWPPRPAALQPGRAAAAPAHPVAQPRVRALPPETRRPLPMRAARSRSRTPEQQSRATCPLRAADRHRVARSLSDVFWRSLGIARKG